MSNELATLLITITSGALCLLASVAWLTWFLAQRFRGVEKLIYAKHSDIERALHTLELRIQILEITVFGFTEVPSTNFPPARGPASYAAQFSDRLRPQRSGRTAPSAPKPGSPSGQEPSD